jgi:hypothetical protein
MVFCFVQNFFFGQNKSLNIYFFCRAKCKFFFPEYNIRVYDKNSESDYFCFPPPKSEYFFPATLGIRIFFSIKTITPPLQVKWSYPYQMFTFTIRFRDFAECGIFFTINYYTYVHVLLIDNCYSSFILHNKHFTFF